MTRQAFRRQPRRLGNRQVRRVVASPIQLQRGVRIFGHGFSGHTTDVQQRRATQYRTGAAEEGRVPQVVAVLQQTVKQLALVGHAAEGIEVLFERVGREEKVRRLQHRQFRVLEKPAHGNLQKGAGRHMVGIEHGDVLTIRGLERFVQIARLGMSIVAAGQIADADLFAELAKILATTIIEHIDPQLVARPVDGLGGKDGQFDDAQRLVVRRNEHIDGRPLAEIARHDHRLALQRPGRLHVTQHDDDQRVELGDDQAIAQQAVQPVVEIQGRGQAPVHVAKRSQQR